MPIECWDESGHVETYDTDDPRRAAEAYVLAADWGPDGGVTVHHNINFRWTDHDTVGTVRVTVYPKEPDCTHVDGHRFRETDMRGNGGGIIVTEQCRHCGLAKVTNTWDYDRSNGEQGLTSITYPDINEDN